MNLRFLAFALVAFLVLSETALAQEEDCASCRTNNFYYVLAAAIIIFAVFFWWANKHRVPKKPETVEKSDENKL